MYYSTHIKVDTAKVVEGGVWVNYYEKKVQQEPRFFTNEELNEHFEEYGWNEYYDFRDLARPEYNELLIDFIVDYIENYG